MVRFKDFLNDSLSISAYNFIICKSTTPDFIIAQIRGIIGDAHFNNRIHLAKHLHFNPGASLRNEQIVSHLGV